MVSPTAKASPLLWVEVTVGVLQLSLAVGAVQLTTALHSPEPAVCVMSVGVSTNAGKRVSATVTVAMPDAVFPAASVTTSVTCCSPMSAQPKLVASKMDSEAGGHVSCAAS